MKILLSFVGSHDPSNDDGSDGPLISLLKLIQYDKVYIFYNNDKFLRRASEVKKKSDALKIGCEFEYINAALPDPTDYKLLYQIMNDRCQDILKSNKKNEPEYYISTTSGTPQMATMWILLNKSKLVPGKLLQVIDAKFSPNKETQIREINLPLDEFPEEKSPDEVKRKLSIYKSKSDSYESMLNLGDLNLIGQSTIFQETIKRALQFAKYPVPVLISGETGTGKEEFAKLIHQNSGRQGNFIPINCAGLQPQLLESELFGYEKGAFTDAKQSKDGLVKDAANGTLFLDEVGEIPMDIQAKLLRFLQDGEYRPLGSNKEFKSDARIIGATHRNLDQMVNKNEFRKDLLQRINAAQLEIPPLRERENDVELLINYFLEQFNTSYNEKKKIEKQAMSTLCYYKWKDGNVRELQNKITRFCILSDRTITLDLVNQEIEQKSSEYTYNITIPPDGINLKSLLDNLELEYIEQALKITNGNKLKAAKLVGYSRIDHKISRTKK